jgi:hypothetical protein
MKHHYLVSCLISMPIATLSAQAQSSAAQLPPSSAQPTPITVSSVCGAGGTYDQLTDPWRHASAPQNIPMGKAPIELTIESTEFSDRAVTEKITSIPDFCDWNTLTVGVYVSTTGEVFGFASGEGEDRGGGGDKMSADALAQLESLMNNLPNDDHRVPPPERRVLVVVQKSGSVTVRLYDTGNLPDSVIEMIRLTGARIKIVTPSFQPDKVLRPEEVESLYRSVRGRGYNDLSVSSDGSIGVLHDFTTKTLTIYEGSRWPDYGLPTGGKTVRVIPEFWQPPTYGGYGVNTEFSPDNRYLLVTWGMRIGALLYDTSTWKPITDPHVFPQNLKEYLHTPDWDLGIAVTEAGETLIWDQQAHRVLSKLQGLGEFEPAPIIADQQGHRTYTTPSAEIQFASFSPDRTRVAIYSGPDDTSKLHVSVWDVESGRKLRDFWPQASILSPGGEPLWWNNGRWLLAPSSVGGRAVWDVSTGRFQGSLNLSGCDARESLVVLRERLQQRCFVGKGQDGKVLEWSVDGVQRQLETFANHISSGGSLPK